MLTLLLNTGQIMNAGDSSATVPMGESQSPEAKRLSADALSYQEAVVSRQVPCDAVAHALSKDQTRHADQSCIHGAAKLRHTACLSCHRHLNDYIQPCRRHLWDLKPEHAVKHQLSMCKLTSSA